MKMQVLFVLMALLQETPIYPLQPAGTQKVKEADAALITLPSDKVLHERLCKIGGVVNDFVCQKSIDKTLGGSTKSVGSVVDIVIHEIEEYSHSMSHVPNIQKAIAAQQQAIIACILQASSKNEK